MEDFHWLGVKTLETNAPPMADNKGQSNNLYYNLYYNLYNNLYYNLYYGLIEHDVKEHLILTLSCLAQR